MNYNQSAIIDKLNIYLKEKKRTINLDHGYCHGLTLLWLYKMSRYQEAWFYDVIKKIVETPIEKLSDIEIDIEKFLAHIEWLQQPEQYIPSIRQMDMDQTMEIPKELPLSSIFNPGQLDAILKVVIESDKMIALSGPDHTIGVFRRGNEYHIFNSNYEEGVAKIIEEKAIMKSIQLLKNEVIQCLFADFDHPTKKLAITINVVGNPFESEKRAKILKMFVNENGYVTKMCDFGLNPLFLACENHDEELAQLLLDKGAEPNKPTNDGRLPLLLASYSGYNGLVERLLEFGAEPDLEGREGLPLYVASKNGHEEVIKTLFTYGASVNDADRDGDTAIFGSVERGHKHITKLLLENGANALHHRKNGDTPMDIAIQKKDWDVVAMMLLYVVAPHDRNIEILKLNRKHIISAVDELVNTKGLALHESRQILKVIKDISYKNIQQNKSTKIPEQSRRNPLRYSNQFFSLPGLQWESDNIKPIVHALK